MSGLLLYLCLMVQAAPPAAAVRLSPVDDSWRDGAFRSYIEKLRSAVTSRNVRELRKLVHDEVVVGPNKDDTGWQKLVLIWRLDAPQNSKLWATLADLLSFGFIREHPELYLSPYLVWRFPRDLHMEEHVVVIRDNAELREAPSLDAARVATLSFDVVQRTGGIHGAEAFVQWMHVRTLDGKAGYINARDVASPLMPRAQFGLRRGRWLLIALETP